jgi:hypothetical protein
VAIQSKTDFVGALKDHLAKKPTLPKICVSCGADLVYLNAVFQVFGEKDRFTMPLGFCPFCDGVPTLPESAVA